MRLKFLILFAFVFLAACSTAQADETPTPVIFPATPTLQVPTPTAEGSGCTTLSPQPTATPNTYVPAISEADYVFGPANAPITIIEYCDFQAPICRSMAAVVGNLSVNHPDKIRLVFRPVPLIGQLDKTELAVQAAISAGDQGKFWEMYDVLFVKSDQWDAFTPEQFETWVTEEASGLGIDGSQFQAGMKSQETVDRMNSMFTSARNVGLQAVPLLIINGKPQPSFAIDYTSIESTVNLILLAERQFTTCPPLTIDSNKQYIATLHTGKGDIVLELYADKAPVTVNSFVFLARQGWFDGVPFHRVILGFMAQAGDPSGSGRGNPGYLFKDEIDPSLKFDKPGLLAMANTGPDTNGSQFFITYAPASQLDGLYTIFGRVLSGMDVLESLTPRDPETEASLPTADKILSVEIKEQ
jgi:cyclophilin family peptidyl-prolyl cis-trans isomerase/protein-disulfide isomerase